MNTVNRSRVYFHFDPWVRRGFFALRAHERGTSAQGGSAGWRLSCPHVFLIGKRKLQQHRLAPLRSEELETNRYAYWRRCRRRREASRKCDRGKARAVREHAVSFNLLLANGHHKSPLVGIQNCVQFVGRHERHHGLTKIVSPLQHLRVFSRTREVRCLLRRQQSVTKRRMKLATGNELVEILHWSAWA